jgi:hypothetical protein
MTHLEVRGKTGRLRVRIKCPSEAKCLTADCCYSFYSERSIKSVMVYKYSPHCQVIVQSRRHPKCRLYQGKKRTVVTIGKTGRLRVRIKCPSEAKCLTADCCYSDLALSNPACRSNTKQTSSPYYQK